MLLNLTAENDFFFLRDAFYGLEYAEMRFPDLTGETHDAFPNPLVGWERTPLANPDHTKEKGRHL